MSGTLKKGVVLLVILFIGFYMFTDPHGLATFAKDGSARGWDLLTQLFTALISFFNALFK